MKPTGMPVRMPGPLPAPRPSYSNGLLGKRFKCVFQPYCSGPFVKKYQGKFGTIVSHPAPEEPGTIEFIVLVLMDDGEFQPMQMRDIELVGEGA